MCFYRYHKIESAEDKEEAFVDFKEADSKYEKRHDALFIFIIIGPLIIYIITWLYFQNSKIATSLYLLSYFWYAVGYHQVKFLFKKYENSQKYSAAVEEYEKSVSNTIE